MIGCHYPKWVTEPPLDVLRNCGAFAPVYVRKTRAWYCIAHATAKANERGPHTLGRCEEAAVIATAELFNGGSAPELRCELPQTHTRSHRTTEPMKVWDSLPGERRRGKGE